MSHRLLILALMALASASLFAQAPAVDDDDPDPKTLENLVLDLGSDDFRQREASMTALRKIGDPAVPFLRRQQTSADLERRQRASDLLIDIEKKGQVFCSIGHERGIISLAFLPGDQTVLTASEDKSIRLWNLADGKQLRQFDGHTKEVWALAVAPDGKSFASSGQDCVIRLWNLDPPPRPRELATLPHYVRCLLFTQNGQRLLAGTFDGNIYVLDAKTGKTVATWTGHRDAVMCVALSPDGSKILSGGGLRDASVCVRDASTGAILQRLVGHQEHVHAVAFADNQHAVSAGHDNIVRLWNIKTGKVEREFKGHEHGVYGLAVSRDGKRLLTGGYDKIIRLWNLTSGEELRRFVQHADGINALAFTSNGRYAVSAGNDRTLRMWYLPRGRKDAGSK
jgi:WD40 repeat protein